jgi:hypothetical protein
MRLWKKIKELCGFGKITGSPLPKVKHTIPMPPVVPPRKSIEEKEIVGITVTKKKNPGRKLSVVMPKATKPRIKRKRTSSDGLNIVEMSLLDDLLDDSGCMDYDLPPKRGNNNTNICTNQDESSSYNDDSNSDFDDCGGCDE